MGCRFESCLWSQFFSAISLRNLALPSVSERPLTPKLTPNRVALVNLGKLKRRQPLLVRVVTTRSITLLRVMKDRYRLVRRGSRYYAVDRHTLTRESLDTDSVQI